MKETRAQYIIFDVDTSSVGVLVFEHSFDTKHKKNTYREIFSLREDIINGQVFSHEHFLKKTEESFRFVAEKAMGYIKGEISSVFVSLASPWISSQKRIIHFEKEKEFIFNKDLEQDILEKAKKEALHHSRDFRSFKNLVLVEMKVLGFLANGHRTQKPYQKKMKSIDICVLLSVMSNQTEEMFQHWVEKIFHRRAYFFSHTIMLEDVGKQLLPHKKSFLSIELGGELSEIILTKDSCLEKIGFIPVGANHIIRSLAENMNISLPKAKSLMAMYQDGFLHDTQHKHLEKMMQKSFLSWFKYFYNFLSEISKEELIPEDFILLSHNDTMFSYMKNHLIHTEEIREHLPAQKELHVFNMQELWRSFKKAELADIADSRLALSLDYIKLQIEKDRK